ncbi:poly [ADP-ribose] polymerase 2-like isoform X1 [Penaeus chinensis]|uniref:poly [ADP-ribose] polymerase 2-like isoform X1 n=1 Tax=Penaeus chinensis TaxID=139456 RepID=UPI001FB6ABAF|nr:poly [ADP-ribose] polymerase 2-like isoform X1 [Penaeus chinensis]XP_047497540.1 poly [ADP-ribose] polymerase 2-like isoform X1 [Penaeus chinensis]
MKNVNDKKKKDGTSSSKMNIEDFDRKEYAIKAYSQQFRKKTYRKNVSRQMETEFAFGVYTVLEMDEEDDWERTLGKKYTPLGKLSQTQIERGQQVLQEIEDGIESKSEDELEDLSSKYYTYIPHSFGVKTRPDLIKDQPAVDKEKEFLKALQQTQVENELTAVAWNQAASAEVQSEPVAPEPDSSATAQEEKEEREPEKKRAKIDLTSTA